MKHPQSRAERRHQRQRLIAKRRFIHRHVWRESWAPAPHQPILHPLDERKREAWGRYAKFNLGCGSTLCHGAKYFGPRRKRRDARNGSRSPAECRRVDKVFGE